MTTYQIEQYTFSTPTSMTLCEDGSYLETFSTLAEAQNEARAMAERVVAALYVDAEVIESTDGMTFFVDDANGESVHKFVVIEKYDELEAVMTPAEIEREFGLASGSIRNMLDGIPHRRPDERTILIPRSYAVQRWGKPGAKKVEIMLAGMLVSRLDAQQAALAELEAAWAAYEARVETVESAMAELQAQIEQLLEIVRLR